MLTLGNPFTRQTCPPSIFSHINTPVHHSCDLLHQTNLQLVPCMADRHHAHATSGGDRRSSSKGTGKHATVLPEAETAAAPPPSAPCGACKFLRRKCADGCVFAPYFGSDQGAARFAAVHKVFGASNVSKLLLHIPVNRRHDAVVTISYEAQARLSDPVYGCVSTILALQQQVSVLQAELALVQNQLMSSRLAMSNALQNSQQQQQQEQQLQMAFLHQPAYSNNSSNSNNIVNLSNFTSTFDLMADTTPSSHLQLSRPSTHLGGDDEDEQESKTISAIFSCADQDLISRR